MNKTVTGVNKMSNNNSDPIMTPREYLTLPKNQAEVFLKLWVDRQPNTSRAAAQAQGLRLKAALCVADGTEQNHPPDVDQPYEDDEDYCYECPAGLCDCDGRYGRQGTGLHWEDHVDPTGRTFKQAWKELGAGIERENQRTAALNAAALKTDSFSPKKEGAAV